MTPSEAITQLDDLLGRLNRRCFFLRVECEDIGGQWEVLGKNQRDDHAAQLLGRLRPHLEELSSECLTMAAQITEMIADPFGRD